MRHFIEIVSPEHQKDSQGFAAGSDTILAKGRAYKEQRRGSKAWQNRAAFSSANALFRFRTIPGLIVTTAMFIICDNERYNIVSVEDVHGRGMYIEVLCEKVTPSKG